MYEQRRLEWDHITPPVPAAVADALDDVAGYDPPAGWEPERLLVLSQGETFRVVLDLAREVQWNLPE